jgi:hypothetical protein
LHTGEAAIDPNTGWYSYGYDANQNAIAFKGGSIGDSKQSHGVFYFGIGPFRFGRDTESIRNLFQNQIAHDGFNGGSRGSAYPWVLTLIRADRWFFQFGWGNVSTLY